MFPRTQRKPGPWASKILSRFIPPKAQIEVICEDCGTSTFFEKRLFGAVQECPKCRGYVDVGELDWPDGWEAE